MGVSSHLYLGSWYKEGKGTKQNFQIAKDFYGKACALSLQAGYDEYKYLNMKGY